MDEERYVVSADKKAERRGGDNGAATQHARKEGRKSILRTEKQREGWHVFGHIEKEGKGLGEKEETIGRSEGESRKERGRIEGSRAREKKFDTSLSDYMASLGDY